MVWEVWAKVEGKVRISMYVMEGAILELKRKKRVEFV